jgi:hypothetical protein
VAALELVVVDGDAERFQRLPDLVRRADRNLLVLGAVVTRIGKPRSRSGAA